MRYSITTKTTIIFAIAFSVVCLLFFTFVSIQSDKAMEKLYEKQVSTINYLLGLYEKGNPPQNLRRYFSNFGFEYVEDETLALDVIKKGESIFKKRTPIGEVQSLSYKKELYLQIQNPSFGILLESHENKNVNDPLLFGFLFISILLISMYISVLKSLLPLRRLSKDIRQFASGNIDMSLYKDSEMDSQDEISNVAREFDNAIAKIRELIRSRQLFLRAIMHELKTPIGKGRIVSEMIDNQTQKDRLIAIFERLDLLINEFSKIEQLLSKSYALDYKECHISLIVEQVSDMLMLDKFSEKVNVDIVDDAILSVDFSLFCLALKNLIDNALKYATDHCASVSCYNDRLVVSNRGTPLTYNIEHYLEAFVRGSSNEIKEAKAGLGLGLYIINQICIMHKFKLDYEYSDQKHNFIIYFGGVA
ncbi:ArsS family sensor histidine kinase [Campylobacter sp. 19-13652]|uniref:ArsS family sensor histidine kinase n=1 Tax=Campylobacter sp. 19-13652 TaxID=2840180 RepID=UPI001C76C145|nr:ArsS family sensor histidine kinase [Campylobacter sp. 19-13652]BCX79693.1 two-component sensor histidine kinase [Campylobacter sp. 19-13652]